MAAEVQGCDGLSYFHIGSPEQLELFPWIRTGPLPPIHTDWAESLAMVTHFVLTAHECGRQYRSMLNSFSSTEDFSCLLINQDTLRMRTVTMFAFTLFAHGSFSFSQLRETADRFPFRIPLRELPPPTIPPRRVTIQAQMRVDSNCALAMR